MECIHCGFKGVECFSVYLADANQDGLSAGVKEFIGILKYSCPECGHEWEPLLGKANI
jgi:hypothetical protein